MTDARYTALVLAASRGNLDPLAQAGGVSHKCFIDIAGEPMLRRVVRAVAESGRVKRIVVAIEEEAMAEAREILAPVPGAKDIVYVASKDNIATSVTAAAAAQPDAVPLVITTGDNALHTPEMVAHFCDALGAVAASGADGAIGLTPARYILEKYPGETRAFHRFRDGQYSSCNLYALLTPRSIERGPEIFRSGGQFGKKPKRLIGAFGVLAFLVYKSRMVSLATFLKLVGRAIGIRTAPVLMPFAEGPIDVDRMQDWELANRIVRDREGG
jgi:CTP:molybdopterin cytidylyltransferase MocA